VHVEFLNTIVKYVDKALKSGVSEMTPKCMTWFMVVVCFYH